MFELRVPISALQADELESHFCDEGPGPWYLHHNEKTGVHQLRGYFDHELEARQAWKDLALPEASWPESSEWLELRDLDWQEAYKEHFRPWQCGPLHWVPVWMKEGYALPDAAVAVYVDPGAAFGTGNHETTRLCARRLLEFRESRGAAFGRAHVIDAGCGSGILAISAYRLGAGSIEGFDNDPESVRISVENARLASVPGDFLWGSLADQLRPASGDLVLANIISDVLLKNAEALVKAPRAEGWLVLSGILSAEIDQVRVRFEELARRLRPRYVSSTTSEGEWADLVLRFD